jgi:hypothetical protein
MLLAECAVACAVGLALCFTGSVLGLHSRECVSGFLRDS